MVRNGLSIQVVASRNDRECPGGMESGNARTAKRRRSFNQRRSMFREVDYAVA
jgi:hypothetical protein